MQATGIRLAIATYISATALCKFVPFDEPLERLHCLAEELEIPKE